MIRKSTETPSEKFADIAGLAAAIGRGVGKAMREHKLMGRSIVVWRDGKVVTLPPEEIPDYDEDGNLILPPTPDAAAKE
jgi:hypothetical protein